MVDHLIPPARNTVEPDGTVGGGWLSKHYYEEIRRNQLSADLLKAYNAADVTLCEGRLCANVDVKSEKFGDKAQYRPVRDRP